MDVANSQLKGTTIVSSDGVGEASAMIEEDPLKKSSLSTGKSFATVQFHAQTQITMVSFLNDGAAGVLTLSGSADQQSWTPLGQTSFVTTDRYIPIQFAGVNIKYLRLAFDVSKSGSVGSLVASGSAKSDQVVSNPKPNEPAVTLNLASGVGGARPIYIFPTPTNVGEQDQNVFKFPKSREKYRTIVYDLGTVRLVKEFTMAYTARPTRLEVFTFEQLPETKDWRGKPTLDPGIFDQMTPVAVGVDARGAGHLKLYPQKPVKAQYIALRFEPNYRPGAAAASVEGQNQELSDYVAQNFGFEASVPVAEESSDFTVYSISLPASVDLGELLNVLSAIFGVGIVDGTVTVPGGAITADTAALIASFLGSSVFSSYASGGGLGTPDADDTIESVTVDSNTGSVIIRVSSPAEATTTTTTTTTTPGTTTTTTEAVISG